MTEQANIRKELMRLSKPKLIKRCKIERISPRGTKSDMVARLINNGKPKKNKQKNGFSLRCPKKVSFKSYTPTTDTIHTNHIDQFQLKPTQIRKMRKTKSFQLKRSKSKRTTTFAVGGNAFGEFGLNHTLTLTQLTNISKSKNISKIYNGFQYTIYADNKAKKYWFSGYNSHGQCGFGTFEEWITKQQQINLTEIKKICTNVGGNCSFWITLQNKIYATGRNDLFQLGIGHKENINKPVLVKKLSKIVDIVDIQPAHSYSIALSSKEDSIKIIVRWWSSTSVPKEILELILKYTQSNTVYCSGMSSYGGNGVNGCEEEYKVDTSKWHKMDFFDDKNIIKIRTGSEHTLLLDSEGHVWCCGDNAFSQLGVGHSEDVFAPTKIKCFTMNMKQRIIIIEIRCGLYHNLAIDVSGKCYSWGLSKRGQCGHGEDVIDIECVETPQLIQYFVDNKCRIKQIECGNYHSFCKTRNAKYYLFGSNQHNQCLTFDGKSKVTLPHCINNIVKQKTNKKIIKAVYLGCNNTKIIVY